MPPVIAIRQDSSAMATQPRMRTQAMAGGRDGMVRISKELSDALRGMLECQGKHGKLRAKPQAAVTARANSRLGSGIVWGAELVPRVHPHPHRVPRCPVARCFLAAAVAVLCAAARR